MDTPVHVFLRIIRFTHIRYRTKLPSRKFPRAAKTRRISRSQRHLATSSGAVNDDQRVIVPDGLVARACQAAARMALARAGLDHLAFDMDRVAGEDRAADLSSQEASSSSGRARLRNLASRRACCAAKSVDGMPLSWRWRRVGPAAVSISTLMSCRCVEEGVAFVPRDGRALAKAALRCRWRFASGARRSHGRVRSARPR